MGKPTIAVYCLISAWCGLPRNSHKSQPGANSCGDPSSIKGNLPNSVFISVNFFLSRMDCRHFLFLERKLRRASQPAERDLLCIKGRMVSILGNFSLRLSSSRVAEIGNGRKLWPISPMCSTARPSLFQYFPFEKGRIQEGV